MDAESLVPLGNLDFGRQEFRHRRIEGNLAALHQVGQQQGSEHLRDGADLEDRVAAGSAGPDGSDDDADRFPALVDAVDQNVVEVRGRRGEDE